MYKESNFLGAQAASLVERFLYILRPYLRGSLGAFTVDASESSLYIYIQCHVLKPIEVVSIIKVFTVHMCVTAR